MPPAQVLVIRVWTKWLPFRYQNPVTSGVENDLRNSVNLSSFPSEFKPGIVLHHPSRLELQPLFSTHFYSLPLRYKLPPADYGFGLAVIVANNSLPTMWIRIIALSSRRCLMLWTIFVILLVLWLLGLVSSYTLGGYIHLLLVIAIVVLVINLLSGRRPAL